MNTTTKLWMTREDIEVLRGALDMRAQRDPGTLVRRLIERLDNAQARLTEKEATG